jgi:hypothetical protein
LRERYRNHLFLGTYNAGFWGSKPYRLPIDRAACHAHIIGVSGSGKSRFLAAYYLGLLSAGIPATLIDPHGDLSRLILGHLAAAGVYDRPDAYERVLYLDIPAAERVGRYLPLNVLAAHGSPHTIASNVKEAFHRAYPELARGAPMFDTLVQSGAKVLISNRLPLTCLFRLLIDKPFRDGLLAQESDADVVACFRDQYDRLPPRDQADQAGAALRRATLLTFSPVLKHSLGQPGMALDFRRILDANQSVIINLAVADAEARRLLGCLLTVAAEQGALSRAELPPHQRHGRHVLIIDEFSEFTAQSEEALARMLSQTRKFGLYLAMAHQTWSQASSRLKGALQNVGLEVVFRLGRDDAEHAAKVLGRVDPRSVSQRQDTTTEGVGMGEQWERFTQQIQDLMPRQAFVLPAGGQATAIRTRAVPDPAVSAELLARIEAEYLARSFVAPAVQVQPPVPVSQPRRPTRRRREPL